MKLKVSQFNLANALTPLSRVATLRTLPILTNIYIEATESNLVLKATDLDVAIEYIVSAIVKEPGKTTLPARFFLDLIKTMPHEALDISGDNNRITVKSTQSKAVLNGIDANDFPELPKIQAKSTITLSSIDLRPALDRVLFAASNDQSRPVLTGVYFKTFEGYLYVVATDSYRLAEARVCKTDQEVDVLIPATSLTHVISAMGKDAADVLIEIDEAYVQFTIADIKIGCRVVEGKYPDYRKLIKEGDKSAELETAIFENVVKVAGVFAKDSGDVVTIGLDESKQTIEVHSVANQLGENTSTAEARITKGGQITLNGKYLAAALGVMGRDYVKIQIGDKLEPVLLSIPGDDSYRHVVMPMKS